MKIVCSARSVNCAWEERLPSGERSSSFYALRNYVEEFAERHPDHRDRILQDSPALQQLQLLFAQDAENHVAFPEKLGQYRLDEEIGRGGMGGVFAATHPSLESGLAIKVLPIGRIRKEQRLTRFHSEARVCAVMDHPHIVPVCDYGLTDEFVFFAMRRIIMQACTFQPEGRYQTAAELELVLKITPTRRITLRGFELWH